MKHNSIIKRCNLLRIPLELRDKRDGSWRFFFRKSLGKSGHKFWQGGKTVEKKTVHGK